MNKKLLKILIFFTILSAPLYWLKFSVFGIPTNVLEIFIFLSLIASIPTISHCHILEYDSKKNGIYIFGIGLILIGLIISTLVNKNYSQGLGIIKGWFTLPIIFGFVVYNFAKTKKDIEKILSFVYLSAFWVSLVSIYYWLLGITTYDGRLEAFYLSPNYLAMYLSPSVFIGLYFLEKYRGQKNKNWFYLFSLFCLLFSLYFTYSYGSWISIILGLAVYIFIKKDFLSRQFKMALIFLAVIFLVFGFQMSHEKFLSALNNSGRSSTASRIMIYKASFKILGDNPIWGIGPGNFQNKYLEYQKYFPPYLEWAVPQPHNLYLAFWLQGGILGIIGFLMVVFFWLRNVFENIRQKNSCSDLAVLLFAIMISILFYGIYDTPYWKNDLSFLFWIIFALGIF